MRLLYSIPLTICGACIGFAVGSLTSGEPSLSQQPMQHAAADAAKPLEEAPLGQAASRALSALISPTRLEDFAGMNALLESLRPDDFPKFIALVQKMPATGQKEKLLAIFRAWIVVDRAAANAWGEGIARKSLGGFSTSGASPARALAEEWAVKFRNEAFAFAKVHWPATGAGHILHNYIQSCGKEELAQCLAQLQTLPAGRERNAKIATHFHQWVQKDFDQALVAARSLEPGRLRDSALAQVIISRGQSAPEKAFQLAIDNGIATPRFLSALGEEAGAGKSALASKWLEEKAPELIPNTGLGFASNWARKEPVAALTWALKHGIPMTNRGGTPFDSNDELQFSGWVSGHGFNSPLMSAFQQHPKETAEWLRSLPPGDERDSLMLHALTSYRNGPETMELFAGLPETKQADVTTEVVRIAFKDQSAKAREWAAALPPGIGQDAAWIALGAEGKVPVDFPPGRARDLMLGSHALSYRVNPEAALALVAKISDLTIQRRSFENVMWNVLYQSFSVSSEQASEVLESAKFPEAWKVQLRASLTKPTKN